MPTKITSSFIESGLKDCLKEKGYKRCRYVWNRRLEGFIHVIEIQDYQRAATDAAAFTINMGVFVAAAFEVIWEKSAPEWVRDVDCVIAERIGRLMPGGFDKWWKIDSLMSLSALAKEVDDAINIYSQIFFDKVRDLNGIKNYMIEQGDDASAYGLRRIYLAMIEFMLGDVIHAKALINSLKEDKVWGERAEVVNRYIVSTTGLTGPG